MGPDRSPEPGVGRDDHDTSGASPHYRLPEMRHPQTASDATRELAELAHQQPRRPQSYCRRNQTRRIVALNSCNRRLIMEWSPGHQSAAAGQHLVPSRCLFRPKCKPHLRAFD